MRNVGATQLKLALWTASESSRSVRRRHGRPDGAPDAVFERIVEVGRGAGSVDAIGVA